MPLEAALPPPHPRERPALAVPGYTAGGVILAIFVAHRMEAGALPSVACLLRSCTGIPCPGCGGTRCLAACGRFDFGAAFGWNPLVFLVAIALLGWSALAFIDPRRAEKLPALFTGPRLAALLVANWLYLCWALPR